MLSAQAGRRVVLTVLALAGFAAGSRAADWPQWMGPKRDGVWREDGILEKFPAKGPAVLWRKPLGPGYTGPAVVKDRVYVMDRVMAKKADNGGQPAPVRPGPGSERVLCLDARDGNIIWKHEYDCPYGKVGYASGPRTTPIVEEGKLYTLGTMGDVYCLDAQKGKVLWRRNLMKDFEATLPVWGFAASPLIVGNRLICLLGGEKGAVLALDKKTGKELWRALKTEEVAYVPPMVYEAGGRKQLIIFLSDSLSGLDPETGKVFWTVPYPEDGEPMRPSVNIATPRLVGDLLFVSTFYHGSMAVRLEKDRPEAKVAWRSNSKNPLKSQDLNTLISTPAVKDGHVYGMCAQGELRCVKASTGQQVWETLKPIGGERANWGTVFFVEQGGRHFLFTDQGELIIAKLTPKGYEEIDRTTLLRPTQEARGRSVVWCHPAFANRCVYVRNDEEIVCVSLAAPGKG